MPDEAALKALTAPAIPRPRADGSRQQKGGVQSLRDGDQTPDSSSAAAGTMVPGGGLRSVVAAECPARNAFIKLTRRARCSAGVTTCLRAVSAICSSVIAMAILSPKIRFTAL